MEDGQIIQLIQTLEGHAAAIDSMVFSPDGSILASGGYDFKIRLWQITSSSSMTETKVKLQKHPQEQRDRPIVNRLLQGDQNDENLAYLARLRIRYRNFPGAKDIQRDLELILSRWGLTEEELYAKTRQIHSTKLYQRMQQGEEVQDWS